MQVLKFIEDSFNSFPLRIKIQLFILPLLLLILLFFLSNPSSSGNDVVVSKTDILDKLDSLKMNEKIVNIINNIEKYANENSLKIKSISSSNKNIKIELLANKKEQVRFVKYLEDYNSFSKIKTLLIKQKNLNIELSFNKIYLKEKVNLKNRITKLLERKDINFKLQAIIDKKVLINNKWLKINDSLLEYSLIKIDSNSVVLENEFERIKLKIYKNENI